MKEKPSERLCRNCGSPVGERYCPRCGQEYGSTRITWRTLYDEMVSLLIGDSLFSETGAIPRYGMLQTLWRFVRHPAVTVGEFIAGKQRKYVPPLTLLLLVCTLCLLTLTGLGYELLDGSAAAEEETDTMILSLFGFMNSHIEIVALLNVPWLALAYRWVFRSRSQLRYMEYFYIGLYLASLHILLATLLTILTHSCGFDPDGMPQFWLGRIITVTLCVYNVVIIRNLVKIDWTRSLAGCLLGQLIAAILSLTVISLIVTVWEIAAEI